MAITQLRSRRKPSGGRYRKSRKKKLRDVGSLPTYTKLGELKKRADRVRSGAIKLRLLRTDIANIYDPKTEKHIQSKIITITDNPANRHFIRRNIITKGTIIKTEAGSAKVLSRPGQDGIVNAILVEGK